jgi:GH35 family endo-1,4-beta-xylanase
MLQLINHLSQTADLYPDTIIPIERNNPLFNEGDEFFADITYGFKLPLTPGNQEFIKNAHLVEAANEIYAQGATLLADGTPLHAGILNNRITGNDIDALMKINFGAISQTLKSAKLSEIYTGDAQAIPYDRAYMLATCTEPKKYPCAFFPVYNEAWSGQENETRFVINHWDHDLQNFNLVGNPATVPYFKLKYLLQKIGECLGFQLDGNWLRDPESEEIYVYTQVMSSPNLNGSLTYLPQELTITDFLKRIKDRFGISCNFDMITGKMNVVAPNSAINTSNVQDLSDYVTSIDEISVPEQKGYSIVLKPDEGDELFLDQTAAKENTYSPTNRLIIGNNPEEIELECSTLKTKQFETYAMPAAKQLVYFYSNRHETFPLRFLRYRGMKDVGGGKIFPQAESMELTLDDALWYKFKNESKQVKLKVTIPAHMLAKLKVYERISFLSKEGNYTIALPEKVSYNLSSGNSSYITATILCRTMVNSYVSDVQLIQYKAEPSEDDGEDTGLIPTTYKAYFDQKRMPYVDIEIHTKGARATSRPIIQKERISRSTDRFGTGGMIIAPPLVTSPNWELCIMTGVPKYAIVGGLKFYFSTGDGYYWLNMTTLPRLPFDPQGVWILFEDNIAEAPILPPDTGGGTGPVNPPVDPPEEYPEEPTDPVEPPTEPIDPNEPDEPPVALPSLLRNHFPYYMGTTLKDNWKGRTMGYFNALADYGSLGAENAGKFSRIQAAEGVFTFGPIDEILDYCEQEDLLFFWHCLIWADVWPDWFRAKKGLWTAAQFEACIRNHIRRVIDHVRPRMHLIRGFDVLNEALGPNRVRTDANQKKDDGTTNTYYSFLGSVLPDFPAIVFDEFNKCNTGKPGFINDFTFEQSPAKCATVVKLISDLAARGITIDGIGSQTHMPVGLNMNEFEKRFRTLASSGKLIHVSELDVTFKKGVSTANGWSKNVAGWTDNDILIPAPTADDPNRMIPDRTKAIETTVLKARPDLEDLNTFIFPEVHRRVCRAVPLIQIFGFTTWEVGDRDSYHNYPEYRDFPTIYYYDYSAKPARQALLAMQIPQYVAA